MCTVIKVKRKITDDPVDCLLIECKKKKLVSSFADSNKQDEKVETEIANDSNEYDSIKQILKYAGSANDDNEIPRLIEMTKNKRQILSVSKKTKPKADLTKRADSKDGATNKQLNYIVVNKKRRISHEHNLEESESVETKQDKRLKNLDDVNIIDVLPTSILNEEDIFLNSMQQNKSSKPAKQSEERLTCNDVELIREKIAENQNELGYVYDIYYANTNDIYLDLLYSNNYEIKSYNDYENVELVNGTENHNDSDVNYEEDDDSNDESNWRNDYPDENDFDEDEYDNDDYEEYGNGYEDDDDRKLSSYLKNSCRIDRSYYEDDDDEEYDEDDLDDDDHHPMVCSKSYASYKKQILKEFKKDYNQEY